jgi:hypothetical protein
LSRAKVDNKMFTWVCPKCGAEVPPSYNECPNCASKTSTDPPSTVAPPSPSPSPGPPAAVRSRTHSPMRVAALSAIGVVALLSVLYLFVLPEKPAATPAATTLQNPPMAGSERSPHPLAKHLEVSGVRITESTPQLAKVQFLVVNHSAADLPEMKMDVALKSPSGDAIFEFRVNLPSIGPYEYKELSSTIKTKLKPYELPDWQLLKAEFQLASEL